MAEQGERSEIHLRSGEGARHYGEAAAALKAASAPFVSFNGRFVEVNRRRSAATDGGIVRPAGTLEFLPVNPARMRLALAETVRFLRFDRRAGADIEVAAPKDLVDDLVCAPERARWPEILALVDHPLIDLETGVPIQPAYHSEGNGAFDFYEAQRQIAFDFGGWSWPHIRNGYSRADAEEALGRLRDLWRHMPFAGEIDQAVALAALGTGVVRSLLPAAPLFVFDAPGPGSGKTLLTETIGIVANGAPPSCLEWPRDADEGEKRLAAALLAGLPALAIDNVERPLGGAALCQTVTAPARDVRVLGKSEMRRVACRSLLLATGNNTTIRGDLVRRSLVARLDAGCERPELREFSQDLRAEARRDRQGLVLAALTIFGAYAGAGRPKVGTRVLGSFEFWSRTVRDALVWAGLPDPCRSQAQLRDADPEVEIATAVLATWHAAFGDSAVRAAEAVATALSDPERRDLREALDAAIGRGGQIDPSRLGYWLRAHRDMRVGGFTIERELDRKGLASWRVCPS